jgi:hypothetical protein
MPATRRVASARDRAWWQYTVTYAAWSIREHRRPMLLAAAGLGAVATLPWFFASGAHRPSAGVVSLSWLVRTLLIAALTPCVAAVAINVLYRGGAARGRVVLWAHIDRGRGRALVIARRRSAHSWRVCSLLAVPSGLTLGGLVARAVLDWADDRGHTLTAVARTPELARIYTRPGFGFIVVEVTSRGKVRLQRSPKPALAAPTAIADGPR